MRVDMIRRLGIAAFYIALVMIGFNAGLCVEVFLSRGQPIIHGGLSRPAFSQDSSKVGNQGGTSQMTITPEIQISPNSLHMEGIGFQNAALRVLYEVFAAIREELT